jgi:predicted ATPase
MTAPRSQRSTSNLPRELTSFVGRSRELAELSQLLLREPRRLVTVVGPPGTGKTRLALRLSRELRDRGTLPGGAWFVDLESARTSAELFERTALVLGLRLPEKADALEFLGLVISARGRALFAFDNVEQLGSEASDVLAAFRAIAPDALMLVTSREPVRIAAEHVYEVGPLALPNSRAENVVELETEAVRLLLDRAPGFSITEENAATVTRVLRVLDGLPLAIELAAARLGVLGIDELERRIHQLDGLGRGPRDAGARQATLRDTLDWSWDLLDADERRALAASSVFRNGFSSSGFVAVTGVDVGRSLDLLQALREKSLLGSRVPEGSRELRFFHYASIATYAREKLHDLGLAARVGAAHLEYFANFAPEFAEATFGERACEALAFLAVEHENIVAALLFAEENPETARGSALRLCLSLEPMVQRRGLLAWYVERLDRALAAPPLAAVSLDEPKAHLARARTLRLLGKLGEAKRDIEDALNRRDLPPLLVAEILSEAGQIELARGQFDASKNHHEQALSLLGKVDDHATHARVFAGIGLFYHSQGRLEEALAAYESGLSHAKTAKAAVLVFTLHKDIGTLRLQQARFTEAREHYDQALAIDPALADPAVVAMIRGNLGIMAQEAHDFAEAREQYGAALDEFSQSGARLYEGHLRGYSAALDHEQRALENAIDGYEEAIAILHAVGDRRLEGLFSAALGAAEAQRERVLRAEEHFARARELLTAVGDPGLLAALDLHRGQLAIAESRIAARRGETAKAEEQRAIAGGSIERLKATPVVSDDARFALRLLERELSSTTLTYDPAQRTLTPPGGEPVDLSSRVPLAGIVHALIEMRRQAPGQPLDTAALLAAGWPGEKVRAEAGANRVKVALSTLRKLGLRDVILHRGDGHVIDPNVPLVVRGEASPKA